MEYGGDALISSLRALALGSFLVSQAGCSLIFGGDQRVDNKSHDYTVVRLDREFGPTGQNEWARISDEEVHPQDSGDVAYEHARTGSIISMNSVCREYREASLEELMHYLLMGLHTKGEPVTREIKVAKSKALESTVEATMRMRAKGTERKLSNVEFPVRVRTVVTRISGCTYDLMFIAKPQHFNSLLPSFERFLGGFNVD